MLDLVFGLTLHGALNLLWFGITLSALAWFARSEAGRARNRRWQRLFAVCAMCVTLFPSVSDSDDLFNFSLLQVPGQRHHGEFGSTPPPEETNEKGTLHLARVLESLDHYQVTGFYAVILTMICVALAHLYPLARRTRSVLCAAGRAPPLA